MTGDDPTDQGEIPATYTLGQHIGFAVCALVAVAAARATWYAIGVDVVANDNVGSFAYQRSFLNSTQMIVAIAGLIPIGIGSLCVAKERWRTAAMALSITLVTYLLWGVLNDAAVHGWGQLKVF